MFFVWDQLITWILEKISEAFDKVSTGFFDFFNMNLDNFFYFIPIKTLFNVFQGIGLGIAGVLAFMTIFSNLFVIITDTHEDSLKVLGRFGLSIIIITFASQIFYYIHQIFSIPFNLVNTEMSKSTFGNNTTLMSPNEFKQWTDIGKKIIDNDNSIGMKLVAIALLIVLFKDFFKLLLEAAERYVVICVGRFTSPLVFSTVTTKRTSGVSLSFVRMIVCEYILMMFNIVFIKGAILALQKFVSLGNDVHSQASMPGFSSGLNNSLINPVAFIILVCAFLTAGAKLDQYMKQMGLDIAQTGAAFGSQLLATGVGVLGTAGMIVRGARRGFTRRSGGAGGDRNMHGIRGAINPNKPKGSGGAGGLFNSLMQGTGLSRRKANFATGGMSAGASANNLNNIMKMNGIRGTEDFVRAGGARALQHANNGAFQQLGQQLLNGEGKANFVRAGDGFKMTDFAGREAAFLPTDIGKDALNRHRGIQSVFDDDGHHLGYVADADKGFGMVNAQAGDRFNLVGENGTGLISSDVAESFGFGDNFSYEALENGKFMVLDEKDNAVGALSIGTSGEFGREAFDMVSVGENGNDICFDAVNNVDALDSRMLHNEDGLIEINDNVFNTSDIRDFLSNTHAEIGDDTHITGIDGNYINMDNGGSYRIDELYGYEQDANKRWVSTGTFSDELVREEATPDSYWHQGVNSFFENPADFSQATGIKATSVDFIDNGKTAIVSGYDTRSGAFREIQMTDTAYANEKGSVISTKAGNYTYNR